MSECEEGECAEAGMCTTSGAEGGAVFVLHFNFEFGRFCRRSSRAS